MQCPSEACEASKRIVEIAKPGRGGHKGFRPAHIIALLDLLLKKGRVGRPKITKLLGIGESSAKTMLKKLENAGLIAGGPKGHYLTPFGKATIEDLLQILHFRLLEAPHPIFSEGVKRIFECTISCVDGPEDLVSVLSLRDYLVAEGCRLALIGSVRNGSVVLPGAPGEIEHALNALFQRDRVNRGVYISTPHYCWDSALSACIKIILIACDTTTSPPSETTVTPSLHLLFIDTQEEHDGD